MISDVLNIGSTIIDKLWADEDTKLKKKQELQELMQKGELEQLNARLEAIKMEAQSDDPWTSRARPMIVYGMLLLILWGIPMGVLFAFFPDRTDLIIEGVHKWWAAIPQPMWWLFGVIGSGYGLLRSSEKMSFMKNIGSKIGSKLK